MRKKKSLKGIHGIYVVIEDLGPEMKGVLTIRELRKRVETHLRVAGIRILKEQEAAKMLGEPYLYLNLVALPLGAKRFACRIDVEFHQLVSLIRDSIRGHAITWDEGVMTVGSLKRICEHMDELIFEFIYDYLDMNPDG